MDINQRFEILIETLFQGNKSAFSKAVGVSSTVIENVVGKRQGKPSYDVLTKIIYAFENISAEWLLTGKGDMFKKKSAQSEGNNVDLLNKIVELSASNAILARELDDLKKRDSAMRDMPIAAEKGIKRYGK